MRLRALRSCFERCVRQAIWPLPVLIAGPIDSRGTGAANDARPRTVASAMPAVRPNGFTPPSFAASQAASCAALQCEQAPSRKESASLSSCVPERQGQTCIPCRDNRKTERFLMRRNVQEFDARSRHCMAYRAGETIRGIRACRQRRTRPLTSRFLTCQGSKQHLGQRLDPC